jgi:hypothetical protein
MLEEQTKWPLKSNYEKLRNDSSCFLYVFPEQGRNFCHAESHHGIGIDIPTYSLYHFCTHLSLCTCLRETERERESEREREREREFHCAARLALNSRSSYPCLPSAGILGVHHCSGYMCYFLKTVRGTVGCSIGICGALADWS